MVKGDTGRIDHLSRILNLHRVIVEVGMVEINEEAWRRRLKTNPGSAYTNIRIFTR